MSRFVILSGREDAKLVEIEERFQQAYEKKGGLGNWQDIGKIASEKISKGEQLTAGEKLARQLGWKFLSLSTQIHHEIFKP